MEEKDVRIEDFNEEDAIKLKRLLSSFIKSYSKKGKDITDKDWLKSELKKELPNFSNEEIEKMAEECAESIREFDENFKSINENAKKGKGKELWLADKIAEASAGISVKVQGQYLQDVDNALSMANAQMLRTVTTKSGEISQCYNLDGYIAEQHHVNTFNANAKLSGSRYYAEVKVPALGETYGKNSVDVVIKDSLSTKGNAVHQYQVKYGANAKATIQLLREQGEVTKYSNQQILVPPEQVEEVRKAFPGKTIVSEIGGTDKVSVKSTPLTKQQAKEKQFDIQKNGEVPNIDWNHFKNKDLALKIGKNAGMAGLHASAMTAGFSLASQAIKGDGIDIDETVEVALKSGTDAGVKHAVAGALKVGIEKDIIRFIPKGTPMGTITNIACVSIENIKIFIKYINGEITFTEALELMGRTSVAMIYGIGWGVAGANIGMFCLSFIPIVGPLIGGFVGGVLGYMAGSKFGEALFNGVKTIAKGAVNVCKTTWNGIKSLGNKVKGLFA